MELDQARKRLKSPDWAERQAALEALSAAWRRGEVHCAPEGSALNLHSHTFFSYNGYDHTPTSLAWLARDMGWYALATVDFDVLDGVDETLQALDQVEVRGAVGIETRVYAPQFAAVETNSHGEPGVMYHIGVGFVSADAPPTAAATLADMRARAGERNREMVCRLNDYLAPAEIDYDAQVLPLTPSGNATERHILLAYDAAARACFSRRADLLAFWASKLALSADQVGAFMGDAPAPHDAIRSKLMKRGGVGYMEPDADSFPRFADVNAMIVACGAIPHYGFVDGLGQGESRLDEMLEYLISQGIAGFNIVPDRNWNIADPEERRRKLARLDEVIRLVRSRDLPILAGTEMNKAGQPLFDDPSTEALQPYWGDFMRGAEWIHGHTVMQRARQQGYQSEWAAAYLPDRAARNSFYTRLGRLVPPGIRARHVLAAMDLSAPPEMLLSQFTLASSRSTSHSMDT